MPTENNRTIPKEPVFATLMYGTKIPIRKLTGAPIAAGFKCVK